MRAASQDQSKRAGGVVRLAVATLVALGAAVAASLALLALNFASAALPRAPIVEAVRQGFADRQLSDYGWLHLNAEIGVHQFNDCLILLMAADDRAPSLKRALSPTIAGASVGVFGGGFTVPCAPLRRFANGERAPLTDASFYHRYVFGNVALTAALLQFASIQNLRTIYSFLALFAPLTVAALALWRMMRGKTATPEPAGPNALAFATLGGLMLAFFFAAQYFGQSLAHFPPDILLTLYLLGVVLLGGRLDPLPALGAFNAMFGALTMYFEFLSGGAPMGAALVLATAAAHSMDRKDGPALTRAAFALGSYAIGFVTIYAIKQTATAMVFGAEIFASSGARLETWLGGATPLQTAGRLDQNLREIGGGSLWIGRTLVLGATAALVVSIAQLVQRRKGPDAPEWGLVAAALVIPAWYLVFELHTYVHAWMMVRIVVMFNTAAFFLLATLNRDAIATVLTRLGERWRSA